MKLARASLWIVGLSFLGLGIMFTLRPAALTDSAEIPLPTPIARMEVRGVYGGFFFGVGLFCALCARSDRLLRPGLIAQASIMGGLVMGRTVGIVLDGAPNLFLAVLLLLEIVGVVIAWLGLKRLDAAGAAG